MSAVLLFSALGVAAIVGLTWVFGGLRTAVLVDLAAAVDLMRRDFIEFEMSDGILSVDGTAALLVPAGEERVGLVFAMGQRFATRLLSRGDVTSVKQVPAPRAARIAPDVTRGIESVLLELRFADFTQSALRVELPVGDEAAPWRSRLESLCEPVGRGGA